MIDLKLIENKLTPITNADLIRHMSDEELAVTLMCPNDMGMAEIACDHGDVKDCCKCCLEWLKSEVEV